MIRDIRVSRRRMLQISGLFLAIQAVPTLARSASLESARLRFHHTHTGSSLDIVYRENGAYLPDALAEIDRIMADFRTGEIHSIDPGLLDFLYDIRTQAGRDARFEIISGYRSPKTNDMLRKRSNGVAKRSLHMQGKAIDVRMSGADTNTLRKIAVSLKRGGVGYYKKSSFVHLDTGRFRTW